MIGAVSLVFAAPELPLHKAGPFVAGAYIVFLVVILAYVAIMGMRVTRNLRELAELKAELRRRESAGEHDDLELDDELQETAR